MLLYQNESIATRRNIPFILVDSTDGYTQRSGIVVIAGNIKVSKNGGAEANHSGTVTEVGGGTYYYQATSGELDTLGYWQARITPSGCRTFNALAQVIKVNLYESTLTVSVATSGITNQGFASGAFPSIYYADINFTVDNTNSQDEYTVSWFKDGAPLNSGSVSSPTIQIVKRSDSTNLIASSSLNYIGSTGVLKRDEVTNRVSMGEAYIAQVTAMIDGATKTWRKLFSRDN